MTEDINKTQKRAFSRKRQWLLQWRESYGMRFRPVSTGNYVHTPTRLPYVSWRKLGGEADTDKEDVS